MKTNKPNRGQNTVLATEWNVGTTMGHNIEGVVLDIFKNVGCKRFYAVYRKPFSSHETATRWCLEHGYLQPFVSRNPCRISCRFATPLYPRAWRTRLDAVRIAEMEHAERFGL